MCARVCIEKKTVILVTLNPRLRCSCNIVLHRNKPIKLLVLTLQQFDVFLHIDRVHIQFSRFAKTDYARRRIRF